MCTVWILTPFGVRAVDSVALQPKARLEQVWGKPEVERPKKAVAKKPVVAQKPALTPAPLQRFRDLVKVLEKDDETSDHYRMRCNEANDRRKACGLRKRRLQVERY